MKVLDALLGIKEYREEKAARAVLAQRRALQEAAIARDNADRSLAEYRDYASAEEQRIYQDLCRRSVRLRDIEDVHRQVLVLRARERNYNDDLRAAELRRDDEVRRLEIESKAHVQARRVRDKFEELAGVLAQEEAAQTQCSDQAEIEESVEVRRPQGNSEGPL